MSGILGWGAYLPYRRLDRTTIAAVAGGGGGTGTRTVASYDEDTTTMGVEAARLALAASPDLTPRALWFSTVEPAYLDKTNATAVHAALRLGRDVPAYDANGSIRSAAGALRAALDGAGPALLVSSGLRTGLPGGPDEAAGGDGAAALVVGEGDTLADVEAWGVATEELLDRWRTPGDVRSKLWEERFGEGRYVDLALDAWGATGVDITTVDQVIVTGPNDRAVRSAQRKLGVTDIQAVDGLASTVGNTGAAHPALLLVSALEQAEPGQRIALIVLADGADAVVLRTTPALDAYRPRRSVAEQVANGGPVPYGKYLAWRGMLPVEPPRRPEPARPSASAAARSSGWKFGFVGSADEEGEIHLPPSPLDTDVRPMAAATGEVVTFTVDKLASSPSPPVVFAVVDFDGGGRLPIELTDCDPDDVAIGSKVEMTFRKLFTADGIHNYFWKGRLVR